MEGFPKKAEVPHDGYRDLEITSSGMQARFALLKAREQHPEMQIDPLHPENNQPGVRKVAALEWVEEGASRYRDYVENPLHAETTLDPENEEELRAVLKDILNR